MRICIAILGLIFITLPTLLPFFNTRFFYTQDHIFIARLNQMSAALADGQFPVRWVSDLRYGEPLYNFYAPLPYYFGALIHQLGFNYIWTAKLLFILSSILSAAAMYIFCRRLFSREAAVFAAVLYTYAPYRALDIYVRGAMSEAWAFIFFPLIFYATLLLSQKMNLKRVLLLAFSLTGLILTHNVTTLMFLPFIGLFVAYLIFGGKWKIIPAFLGAGILSLGLSAFFLLPALFERQFIQTKYLIVGYFDFRAHFVAYQQFFSTFWGYGSSLWGKDDGLSFQVGLIHWATLVLAVIVGFIYRTDKKLLGLLSFLMVGFIISIFLQHNKSAFIWEAVPMMAFIQFPWRFLAISVFFVSIAGAAIAGYLKDRFQVLYFVLIGAVILFNLQYFKPKEYVDNKFFDKFLQAESLRRGTDLTKDYLPVWVEFTDDKKFDIPQAETGEIKVSGIERRSAIFNFSADVTYDALIEAPITYFPGWEVWANNQIIPQSSPSERGLIKFELPKGNYRIKIQFKDTQIRRVGNIISLSSAGFTVLLLIYNSRKRFNG